MSHISTESEAAGEIVNIAVKGATEAVTLAGRGALNLAAFLLAALKEQQRTKGKVNLRAFRAKSTTVFNRRIYHKAYFSLDCEDGIENDAIGWEQPSPEELIIQAEEEAEHEQLLQHM